MSREVADLRWRRTERWTHLRPTARHLDWAQEISEEFLGRRGAPPYFHQRRFPVAKDICHVLFELAVHGAEANGKLQRVVPSTGPRNSACTRFRCPTSKAPLPLPSLRREDWLRQRAYSSSSFARRIRTTSRSVANQVASDCHSSCSPRMFPTSIIQVVQYPEHAEPLLSLFRGGGNR